jgi:hypothetical protein
MADWPTIASLATAGGTLGPDTSFSDLEGSRKDPTCLLAGF